MVESRNFETWKTRIDQLLSQTDYFEAAKGVLSIQHSSGNSVETKEQALERLRTSGLIEAIVSSVAHNTYQLRGCSSLKDTAFYSKPLCENGLDFPKPMRDISLLVDVIKGRAFLEQFLTYDDFVEEELGRTKANIVLHISHGGFRCRSRSTPYKTDVDITEHFIIPLSKNSLTPEQLILDRPASLLNLVMVSKECATGKTHLIASAQVDWRGQVFTSRTPWTCSFSIELTSVDPDSKVTAGILDLRLTLLWPELPSDSPENDGEPSALRCASSSRKATFTNEAVSAHIPSPLPLPMVEAQLKLEQSCFSEQERSFTIYTRQWWHELTQLRGGIFTKRNIKLFAVDENSRTQFVCSFVFPLCDQRRLDTLSLATRFVATIPCEAWHGLGAGTREQWCSGLAFVARNRGDVPDHANLLCSLLLGLGLDAYVALGARQSAGFIDDVPNDDGNKPPANLRSHAWVVVLQFDQMNNIFLDPVSGRRYLHTNPINPTSSRRKRLQKTYPYHSIGCLYNHTAFYANIQPTDSVYDCQFDLNNPSLWRPMSSEVISAMTRNLPSTPALMCLSASNCDTLGISELCEVELRRLVTKWRLQRDSSLSSNWQWDTRLCQLLGPVIAGFEADQLRLSSLLTEEQQQDPARGEDGRVHFTEAEFNMAALRRYVPEGYSFKAYPIQLLHHNPRRILMTSLQSQLCRDILACRGDHVRLGVRVRVYSYAEDAVVCWAIFACIYLPVV